MSKRKYARQNRPPMQNNNPNTKREQPAVLPKSGMTVDAMFNMAARLGSPGVDNLLSQNEYGTVRLTQNYQLLDSLYRSDWIARRIVDAVPQDMTKNWLEIKSQIPPDLIDDLNYVIKRTRLQAAITEGLKLGRLYGGAVGIMIIDGQNDILDQPLDLEMVTPESFKGLLIADRWNGAYPSSDLVTDLDDPDFGLPDYYTFCQDKSELENGTKVHHSRVVRFEGGYLPYTERIVENYWGTSVLEHVFDELNKRNTTSANIAQLIFRAQLHILKMSDLGQILALGDAQQQKDLYNVLGAQNRLMNSMGLMMMDKDDDFSTTSYTFSGLSDVYELFMQDISGAAEIPATKLFGRSPAGMNSTGESDLTNYYDMISQLQEGQLRPILERIMPVLCLSVWGAIPDDLDFEFNSVRDISDEDRASLIQQMSGSINSVFQSGIISQRTALMELRQSGEPLGMWDNITDEDIDNADDVAGGGEEGGDMGDDPMAAMMGAMGGGTPGGMPGGGEPNGKAGAEQPVGNPEQLKKPAQPMPQEPQKQPPQPVQPQPNKDEPQQKDAKTGGFLGFLKGAMGKRRTNDGSDKDECRAKGGRATCRNHGNKQKSEYEHGVASPDQLAQLTKTYKATGARAGFVSRAIRDSVNKSNPDSSAKAIRNRRKQYSNLSCGLANDDGHQMDVLPFDDDAKREDHVSRHGLKEMGFLSADEYESAARDFMTQPLDQYMEEMWVEGQDDLTHGQILRYNHLTNEFGAIDAVTGVVKTYYAPVEGVEYWIEKVNDYGEK